MLRETRQAPRPERDGRQARSGRRKCARRLSNSAHPVRANCGDSGGPHGQVLRLRHGVRGPGRQADARKRFLRFRSTAQSITRDTRYYPPLTIRPSGPLGLTDRRRKNACQFNSKHTCDSPSPRRKSRRRRTCCDARCGESSAPYANDRSDGTPSCRTYRLPPAGSYGSAVGSRD